MLSRPTIYFHSSSSSMPSSLILTDLSHFLLHNSNPFYPLHFPHSSSLQSVASIFLSDSWNLSTHFHSCPWSPQPAAHPYYLCFSALLICIDLCLLFYVQPVIQVLMQCLSGLYHLCLLHNLPVLLSALRNKIVRRENWEISRMTILLCFKNVFFTFWLIPLGSSTVTHPPQCNPILSIALNHDKHHSVLFHYISKPLYWFSSRPDFWQL